MVNHCTVLVYFVNIFAGLGLISLAAEVLHQYTSQTPPTFMGQPLNWATSTEYKLIVQRAIRHGLWDMVKLLISTACINAVIFFKTVSRLCHAVEGMTSSRAMRSALFHTIWSSFTLSLYEFGGVLLFSTWLLTISDSGLNELSFSSGKTLLRSLALLSVGATAWFLAGYLAGRVNERWRAFVFPVVTLLMLLQVVYDIAVEPDYVRKASMAIPPGEVRDEVSKVSTAFGFSFPNIRFRQGLTGAGQTFGWRQNVIIISAPDISTLQPDEWAALVAQEIGHWRYHDLYARMFMRLCSRFLWAPSALWLMSQPSFFTSFGIHTESLVIAFALTELYAAKFDQLVLLIKQVAWRAMEARVDRFVMATDVIDRKLYVNLILKTAYINKLPLTHSILYSIFISGRWCPLVRAEMIVELPRS
jgi:Zn-dependent protease with chaperone function